jgi:type II secretion system protein I
MRASNRQETRRGARGGFAIIELLIAITILSIVLLGIISGVSKGILAIAQNRNITKAMLIAKNKLAEFQIMRMRAPDVQNDAVKEYEGFTYSRTVTRFEHEFFGPLSAKKLEITVKWEERGTQRNYSISYIYPEK